MEPVLMEQIAMYMTSLPCPPIPVVIEHEGKPVVCSSHDLMAGVLIGAMDRKNRKEDAKRKQKQMAATRKLVEACRKEPVEHIYHLCVNFTAEYLHSFEDERELAIHFLDMDDVERGSKVHKGACSWHAAQDILFCEKSKQRHASIFAKYTYKELIHMHWLRVRDEDMWQTPCSASESKEVMGNVVEMAATQKPSESLDNLIAIGDQDTLVQNVGKP